MCAFRRGTEAGRGAEEAAEEYGERVFLSPRSRPESWSSDEDRAENEVDGGKLG